jgi:DNA polymerase I-like protein with 3'-5' exonuclease and polymerase domains
MFDLLLTQKTPADWRPDEPPSLDGISEVAIDTETTGLRWYAGDKVIGISVAWTAGGGGVESRYLPFSHRGGGNLDEAVVRRWAETELKGKRLIGLNLKFDAHFLREWGVNIAENNTLGDVAHYAALLDDHRGEGWHRTETPFSLEAVGLDYAGEGKIKGLLGERMADYHASQVTPYARQDAALVIKVMAAQRPLLERDGLTRVAALEDSVIPVVVEMEKNAARIDVAKLRRWNSSSESELESLRFALANMVGWAVNPDKPEHMARLFREQGIKSEKYTDTGRDSFDSSVLSEHMGNPVIAQVVKVSHLADLRAKFITPYVQAVGDDGLLRFSLNQLKGDQYGTVSGRFSSSKPEGSKKGANIQQVMSVENQKKRSGDAYLIRELFIPDDGKLLMDSDAKQIELRVFAHFANSKAVLDAYAADQNTDFHRVVCDMVQRFKPGFTRKDTKNLSFAILFGAGVGKTAEMLGVDEDAGRAMRDTYFKAFPEARRLMDLASKTATERGYVYTLLGRRSRFPRADRTHKALNAAVQGTAADINKLKLVELYAERKRLGLKMRYTVHDEVVGDVADAEAARQVGVVLDRQSLPLRVPILWDTRVARNWAEAK